MSTDPTDVLYIGGHGRSGSTLLDRMLEQADSVVSVGEFHGLWVRIGGSDYLCGCSRLFRECPFWTAVLETAYGSMDRAREEARTAGRLQRKIYGWRLNVLTPRLAGRQEAMRELGRAAAGIYRAVRQVSGARLIVDSTKAPYFAEVLNLAPDVRLLLLQLVRDSRGVAFSWRKTISRTDTFASRSFDMPRLSLLGSALRWNQQNRAIERLGKRCRVFRRLRYEDFARAPRETLADLLDWGGLPAGELPFLEGNRVTLKTGHGIFGNPIRSSGGSMEIREDNDWERGLSRTQQFFVTMLTRRLLSRYGYLDRAQPGSGRG